jgi:hypothetical protein
MAERTAATGRDGDLAHRLTEAGHAPEHLDVSAKVTLDERDGAPTVNT